MQDTQSDKAIDADDVRFNARAIAGAWEACDDLPAEVAAAIVSEFTNAGLIAPWEGDEVDRDVVFDDHGILVEEKAVGVCDRDVAEKHAPKYVELDRDDGKVLAVNPAQIFFGY